MIKYLFICLLLLGCYPDCEAGESEACSCGARSYINYCTPDGFYPDCNCYDNGGDGYNPPEGDDSFDSDYHPGDTSDSLLDYFPECEATYVANCEEDEIKIPCTNLCWRRCPVGMFWQDGHCTGVRLTHFHTVVEDACKQEDQRYRFPTLDEVAYLLSKCYTDTFNYQSTNYCSSYQQSAMRYVMDLPKYVFIDSWVGELDWCEDAYGSITQSCAWYSRLHVTVIADTEFDWFYADRVASGGMCVREQ